MLRRLRTPIAWLALLAWLAASGLSWDLLQVVAWTRMSVDNAASRTAAEAVAKTMEDAPCALCKVARAGRQNAEKTPLAKQEAVKEKTKADPVPAHDSLISGDDFAGRSFLRPVDEFASVRIREVPVPPPRARV